MVRGIAARPIAGAGEERDMADRDIKPAPSPKCGNPSTLFTPKAQRDPYVSRGDTKLRGNARHAVFVVSGSATGCGTGA